MFSLPDNVDPTVRRYFEYYNLRLQGQSIEEIAQALGFWSPNHPYRLPTDLYRFLKKDGFPVCEVCGETPAPVGHCGELSQEEKSILSETALPMFALRRLEDLKDAIPWEPEVFLESRPLHKQGPGALTWEPWREAIWISLKDGRRAYLRFGSLSEERRGEGQKYRPVRASTGPSKTDRAVLAALVILEARAVDHKRVHTAYRLQETMLKDPEGLKEAVATDPRLKNAKFADLVYASELDFPLALLSHYRDELGFKDFPEGKRAALLQRLCKSISELLSAAENLQACLEYGSPTGRPNKLVKDVERDIRAAELKDALGLTHRRVGEILGVPLDPDYYALKGSNKRVEDMVRRGRKVLVELMGEEVYERHISAVKPYLRRWYSLLEEGRLKDLIAEELAGEPKILLSNGRWSELQEDVFEGKLKEDLLETPPLSRLEGPGGD